MLEITSPTQTPLAHPLISLAKPASRPSTSARSSAPASEGREFGASGRALKERSGNAPENKMSGHSQAPHGIDIARLIVEEDHFLEE